jgi:hypothetical protein
MLPKTSSELVFALTGGSLFGFFLGFRIVIVSMIAELLSDLILVVWPLLMLYKIKLSRPKDRPLVIISLGCSIFTFPLILAIVIFNFGPITRDQSFIIIVVMLAQMTVSFEVC